MAEARGLNLGFGLWQRSVQSPRNRAAVRHATKPQPLAQAVVLGQERVQFLGFKRPQHHRHDRQQQKGATRERPRAPALTLGGRVCIVFFHLLHYLKQRVGGIELEVGHHKPGTMQRLLALCYPRRIYAQASYKMNKRNGGKLTMRDGFKIVDTDAHMMEPEWLWERHMEDAYQAQAPKMGQAPGSGRRTFLVEGESFTREKGKYPMAAPAFLNAATKAMERFERARKTGFSAQSRLEDMGEQGVDVQI